MSYNNGYSYAPYFQNTDQNPSGSNQQAYSQQRNAPQTYYHVDSSTPSNEHYTNQRQYSMGHPSQPNPVPYAYQSYRRSDGSSETMGSGETHTSQGHVPSTSRSYIDTTALGSLAYASALGSNGPLEQGTASRHLPSTAEQGGSTTNDTASSRPANGFLPPRPDGRSTGYENPNQAYNSQHPHTTSLAASAVAQARRQLQGQPQTSTATSSASHPSKSVTTVEQSPQSRPSSTQSHRESDSNRLYHRSYNSPVDQNHNQSSFQPPVNNSQQAYHSHRMTAVDDANKESKSRTANNTISNHRETSNHSPVLQSSYRGNGAQAQNGQPTRGRPIKYAVETSNTQRVEREARTGLVSPPVPEDSLRTVNPNQVFNQQEYQKRKAAAEAEAQAAKKAAQTTSQLPLNTQSSKTDPKNKDKEKREGEIKSLLGSIFGYMREMKAKDPEMFLQVWEEFKKDQPPARASSQAPNKDSHNASNATNKSVNTGSPFLSDDNQLPSPGPSQIEAQNPFAPNPSATHDRSSDIVRPAGPREEQISKYKWEAPTANQPSNAASSRSALESTFKAQVESSHDSTGPESSNAMDPHKAPFRSQPKPSSVIDPQLISQRPSSTIQRPDPSTSNEAAPGAMSVTEAMQKFYTSLRSGTTNSPSNLHDKATQQPLSLDSQPTMTQRPPAIISNETLRPEHGRPNIETTEKLNSETLKAKQPNTVISESQGVQSKQTSMPTPGWRTGGQKAIRWSDARNQVTGSLTTDNGLHVQTGHPTRSPQYLMDRAKTGFAKTNPLEANAKNKPPPAITPLPRPSMSKAEMARKRSFNEIVDLTQDISDDDGQAPTKRSNITNSTKQPELSKETIHQDLNIDPPLTWPVPAEMLSDPRLKERPRLGRSLWELMHSTEPLSEREKLRLAVVAQPIDERHVTRQPFNRRTFARDIMISTGTHPTEKPLNWHLIGLQKIFLHIHNKTDLSTIRWDILDPGGPAVIHPPTDNKNNDADYDSNTDKEVPEFRVNPVPQQQLVGVAGGDDADMDMVGLVHEERARPVKSIFTAIRRGRPRGRPSRGFPSRGFLHNPLPRVPSSAFILPTRTLTDPPENQTGNPRPSTPNQPSSQADVTHDSRSNENPVAAIDLSQFGAGAVPANTSRNPNNGLPSMYTTLPTQVADKRLARDGTKRGRPPGAKNKSKEDKNSSQHSTPESSKPRGRPPGSKNVNSSSNHILGSTPRMPSGLRDSEALNDGIAIMMPSRSPSRVQLSRSPLGPKRNEISGGRSSGPRKSSKTKTYDQPTSPKYQVYKCLWKGCHAELHNLETLQKHVFKLHCVDEHNRRIECQWSDCGGKHEMKKDTAASNSSNASLRFPSVDLLKRHIEKSHLRQTAWELGDGPPTHPSDVEESDYLSDAQGRQVTPRIQEPYENSYSVRTDQSPMTRRAIGVVIPRLIPTSDNSTDVESSPENMDIDPPAPVNGMNDGVEYIGP